MKYRFMASSVAALLLVATLDADAETLTETHNAQLATFVLSMVVLDAVERVPLREGQHRGHHGRRWLRPALAMAAVLVLGIAIGAFLSTRFLSGDPRPFLPASFSSPSRCKATSLSRLCLSRPKPANRARRSTPSSRNTD